MIHFESMTIFTAIPEWFRENLRIRIQRTNILVQPYTVGFLVFSPEGTVVFDERFVNTVQDCDRLSEVAQYLETNLAEWLRLVYDHGAAVGYQQWTFETPETSTAPVDIPFTGSVSRKP